jgi:hypothetical protein
MDYRAVLLLAGVYGGAIFAVMTGCNAPDPAAITFSERPSTGAADPGASPSAQPSGPADAGPAADSIFGLEAFNYQDPGQTANNASAQHQGTVEGKDCIVAGCHLDTGPKWLFGGTVYTANTGGTTVAKAEIKVVAPDGGAVAHAYTDANGNFWVEQTGDIPAGSKAGVRTQGGVQHMLTALQTTDKGCNANKSNCHGTAGTGKVFVQ